MNYLDLFYFLCGIILIFTGVIVASYAFLGSISIREGIFYFRKNSFTRYREILTSPLSPPITLIAPAYNEAANIVDSVRSFLSLQYPNMEIVVVNDGSKDDTLEKLIKAYSLVPSGAPKAGALNTKPIRAVYRSTRTGFKNLVVVDKQNGGKGDALNAGINVSTSPYVVNIDVDCILEPDALLKLAKPVLESGRRPTIAVGGVIRIANNCRIEGGKMTDVRLPHDLLSRFQVLEYIRAFLLGRMAWSRLNGLLIISGAMGMFDKNILIKAGGYDTSTVGEDMEVVVRMRRYMLEHDLPYRVKYIPDPLCWTECPSSLKVLTRQRNRWARGTIETLLLHKKMLFNPRYGLLGTLSMPYWLFFEWWGPLLETLGIIAFIVFVWFGLVDWSYFLWLFAAVYAFSIMYSLMALIVEEVTYRQYTKRGDFWRLLIIAMLEPLLFHPITLYSSVKGNIDLIRGKHSWGKMERKGFSVSTPKNTPTLKPAISGTEA